MTILKWLFIRILLLYSVLMLVGCSYNSFNRTITIRLIEEDKPKPVKVVHTETTVKPETVVKPVPKKKPVVVKHKIRTKKSQWRCSKVSAEVLNQAPPTPTDKLRALKPDDKAGVVRVLLDYIQVLKEHNAKLASQLRVVNGQLQKCQTR